MADDFRRNARCDPAARTAIAWQLAPNTVLRTGFGLFSDLLPGSVVDLVGANPPYSKTFQGGLLGTVGGTAIAPGVPNSAIDATAAANQNFNSGFAQGQLSCASPLANRNTCLQPISITAVPDGKLHAPYFMQWSFALEHQVGNALNLRAQYVGTRAVNQPYETQVNGYQTVCHGCFAPFPYGQPTDPRFGAGDAIEHWREQPLQRPPINRREAAGSRHSSAGQLHLEPLHGHGLEWRIPAVLRGRNPLAAAGRPWPPIWSLRLRRSPQLHAQYVYQLPIKFRNRLLARALNGWQVSGTVFWHSGLPFSVLSAPYSANGNGIVQGSGPQYASVVPEFPCMSTIRSPA